MLFSLAAKPSLVETAPHAAPAIMSRKRPVNARPVLLYQEIGTTMKS